MEWFLDILKVSQKKDNSSQRIKKMNIKNRIKLMNAYIEINFVLL